MTAPTAQPPRPPQPIDPAARAYVAEHDAEQALLAAARAAQPLDDLAANLRAARAEADRLHAVVDAYWASPVGRECADAMDSGRWTLDWQPSEFAVAQTARAVLADYERYRAQETANEEAARV